MTLDLKSRDTLDIQMVKNHLVVLDSDDDQLIEAYIQASFEVVERYIHAPITSERYYAYLEDNKNTYALKHAPSNVYLYQDDELIKEIPFKYNFPYLTIDEQAEGNIIRADVAAANNPSIEQARLLLIGTYYKTRENEDFSNLKEIPFGVQRLLDLNTRSYL